MLNRKIPAMQRFSDDALVQAAGGRALQNLALDQNNKGGIASAGGIQVLVAAMEQFPDDSAVQMGGCGTFQNLVWGNDETEPALHKPKGVDCIPKASTNIFVAYIASSLFLFTVQPSVA
jgi:hypothetical protein